MNRLILSSRTASRDTLRDLVAVTAAAGVAAIALSYSEYRRFAGGGEEDADMVATARDHGAAETTRSVLASAGQSTGA